MIAAQSTSRFSGLALLKEKEGKFLLHIVTSIKNQVSSIKYHTSSIKYQDK